MQKIIYFIKAHFNPSALPSTDGDRQTPVLCMLKFKGSIFVFSSKPSILHLFYIHMMNDEKYLIAVFVP